MSTVLVTGATGFVGKQLALRLAGSGHNVHAMYRSEAKIGGLEHENIKLFKGTLTDLTSIDNAMEGCDQVYHLAAFAAVWTREPEKIYEQNVKGTVNILESALKFGVKRVVHTSTAGVFGPSGDKPNYREQSHYRIPFYSLRQVQSPGRKGNQCLRQKWDECGYC